MSAMYDNFAKTFSESRHNHPWPELDAIIQDIKKHSFDSVLDIGCGNGRFLEEARKNEFIPHSYHGIDNSSGMIDEAKKSHPDYIFSVCPMESMNIFPDMSFDAIILLASFHHLDTVIKRMETLTECYRILKEQGRIYITNWNLFENKELFERYQDGYSGSGDFQIKIGEYDRYYHGFTLSELTRLFRVNDFHTERHEIFDWGKNIFSILHK